MPIERRWALEFDGSSTYVDCGNDESLNITDAITIEVGVKTNQQGVWKKIVTKGIAQNSAFWLSQGPFSEKTYFGVRNQDNNVKNATYDQYLPIGEWVHLVGTYDGSNVKLYWNGVLVATEPHSGSIYTNNQPVRISGYSNGAEIFNGLIDEVRIYNRALTESEIQRLYEGKSVNPEGLILHYDASKVIGNTWIDLSGNGNHGTIHGCRNLIVPRWDGILFGDGSYVQANQGNGFNLSQFSVEVLFLPLRDSGKQNLFFLGGIPFYFTFDGSKIGYQLADSGGWHLGSFGSVPFSKFSRAIITWDGNSGKVSGFLNGERVFQDSGYGALSPSSNPWRISGVPSSDWVDFLGVLSELKVYNRVLSDTEIDRHFRGLTPSKSGLVLWHKYTKQTGTIVPDLSGNGNDGTVYGAEWTRREPVR